MHRRDFIAAAAAAVALPAQANDSTFTYRGFSVDMSGVAARGSLRDTRKSLERQIDIVIDAALPADMLAFMRTKTLTVVSKDAGFPGPGHYRRGGGIEIKPAPAADKPIVLHEMLHALHHERLPQGKDNPTILDAYKDAQTRKLWPFDAYVMSDVGEFFAVTGSIYLYGRIDREPFNRANIRRTLPKYYQWLADLFDRGRAR